MIKLTNIKVENDEAHELAERKFNYALAISKYYNSKGI